MKVLISREAFDDLSDGVEFYNEQEKGAGVYFWRCVRADIDSLAELGGIHARPFGRHHRMICSKHPYAVFYDIENDCVVVKAVLDCRRRPVWIVRRLKKR